MLWMKRESHRDLSEVEEMSNQDKNEDRFLHSTEMMEPVAGRILWADLKGKRFETLFILSINQLT